MSTTYTSASCPSCETTFHGVPVDTDDEGNGYAALEARPCADCGALLCACCPQFHCDGCGDAFCSSHQVSVPDGTERPLALCQACAAECEPCAACPQCGGEDVHTEYVFCGIESTTGYQDAGGVFTCKACGLQGDPEELVYRGVNEPAAAARKQPGLAAAAPERALPASA